MPRGRIGWYCYDWASSVFTTVLTSVFFGPYVTTVAERAADGQGYVHPLGIPMPAGSFMSGGAVLAAMPGRRTDRPEVLRHA
jgi:UMF1 family MFS transporter